MSGRSPDDEEAQDEFVFGETETANENGNRDETADSSDRPDSPHRESTSDGRDLLGIEGRTDVAVTIVLVIGLLLATVSVAYAVTVPTGKGGFTAFSLLTASESGELVARDYPTNFTRGESKPVIVAVANREREPMDYTIVVETHRIQPSVNGSDARVLDERELRRFRMSIPANETRYVTYDVRPTMTGEPLRVAFLLYRGEAPADPTTANAYRELHLTVNVTAPPS